MVVTGSDQSLSILECTSEGFYVLDEQFRFSFVNHAAERLLGRSRDTLLGLSVWDEYPATLGTPFEREFRRAMTERVPVAFEECYAPWERYFEVNASPLDDNGIVVHFRDVTEQHRVQEELDRRTRELERSNDDLQRFAYLASHDLQEPLRTISSFSQLLARRNDGRLDDDSQQYIRYIVNGASRMKSLIQSLLEYSRVSHRPEVKLEPVSAMAALGLALANLQYSISEQRARINFDPLPVVLCDEGLLARVFQNLIGNALKYRSDDPPEIAISALKDGHQWIFSVRDNGIGIAPQHHERIFEVFERLHDRAEYPGNGIGLAVCRRIIERKGGRMWVESEPGKGSTFYFTLKAAPDAAD